MFTKNLFKLSTLLVVLTLVLSVAAFAQTTIYVSATSGDDVFGAGTQANPYSSIGKAIAIAAAGSSGPYTVSVEAGTYQATTVRPAQTAGTGVEDNLAVTTGDLTFVATSLNSDNNVYITNGIQINTTGTVNIGLTGQNFNLGTTANALNAVKGTLNLGTTVTFGNGGTLTVGNAVITGVPKITTKLFVVFNGANALATTAAFLPASLGTAGTITVNKASGALTIDNSTLTVGAITVTTAPSVTFSGALTCAGITINGSSAPNTFAVNGNLTSTGDVTVNSATSVSLNGNVTMGTAGSWSSSTGLFSLGCKDIVNANSGTLTIGTSSTNTLNMYSTVDVANTVTAPLATYVGEIKNTGTGSIVINASVTENLRNTGWIYTGANTLEMATEVIGFPLINNTGASTSASIVVNGPIAFLNNNAKGIAAANTDNQFAITVQLANASTGSLLLNGALTTPASTVAFAAPDSVHVNVCLLNTGGGTFTTRSAALRGQTGTLGNFRIINGTIAGTMTLGQAGDAFTTATDIVNDISGSTLTLNGTGTLGGTLTNGTTSASTVVLGASQTISGVVTVTTGAIKLNSNTLTLTKTAVAALTGSGDIYSAATATTGSGLIKFTGAASSSTYTGNLPNVEITSATSGSLAGNTIYGNLVTSGAGAVTIAGATGVKGNFNLTGAGTVTTNGLLTVSGDVNMTAGNITLGTAGLTVGGTFSMPQGTLNLAAQTLTLNGNFNRTAGTVTNPNTGTLVFSGTAPQTFNPGTQMNVYNVTVNSGGTYVAGVVANDVITMTGSLFVLADFNITAGQVVLGTNNIRMEQTGTSARFTNGGRGYSASGIGGIIFEGSGANPAGTGDGAVITGTNAFSNVFVRLTTMSNNVYCLGAVKISGTVTLDGGGIIWNAANDVGDAFTSSTLTLDQSLTTPLYPTVVINTINTHGSPFLVDGADGGAVALAITTLYNLSYTGSSAATMSATDFVTSKVNNLSLIAGTGKTVTGTGAAMAIAGNLSVDALDALDLASQTLTLSNNSGVHIINGTVTGTGTVAVTGNAATLGSTSSTGASSIASGSFLTVTNASGTFASTGMKVLGDVTINGAALAANITMNTTSASIPGSVTNTNGTTTLNMNSTASAIGGNVTVTTGTLTLTMNGAAVATATITGTLNVNGGTFNMGSHLWVTGAVTHTGTSVISLGDNNLTLADNYTNGATTATFSAGAGAVIAKTTATKNYTFAASGTSIPNFTLNSTGFGIALVTNGFTVSNAFVHTDGDINLGALPLTISGNTWKFTTGTYTSSGAGGVVNLTGAAVVLSGDGSPTVPYLTINTTGSFTINATSAAVGRTLSISQLLTQTKGTINLGGNDIAFTGGTGFTFTAGTIADVPFTTSGTTYTGELIFSGATGFTPGASKSLTIPNLTVSAATTVAGTDSFYVAKNLTFGAGGITCAAGRMILNNGVAIIRVGASTLSALPAFAGVVDVTYKTVGVTTDIELPTTATNLRNLTINIATTLNKPATVNGTLQLAAALTTTTTNCVNLAIGATVAVGGGSIATPVIPAGLYNLYYANGASITTTVNEWPSTASINNLTVAMTGGFSLNLAFNRTIASFTLNCGTGGGKFDLSNAGSAYTLTVTGVTTITSGTLMTTTSGGTLIVQGDVNASGGSFGTTIQMAFTGASDQIITTPSGGSTIGNITINKVAGTNKVTIAGGDLTCSGVVTFSNGLIVTGTSNALVLTNGAGLTTAKGYTRSLVAGGTSHVVGNVKQNLEYSTLIAYARNEFPVGDTVNYRPVALTFLSSSSGNYGIFATVSHTNSRPTGTAGLPIANGIASGIALAKYPGFFWSIKTDGPMGNTAFNLDLTAAGDPTVSLTDVGLNQVKIIRRSGVATDLQNQWNLQGTSSSYDNVVSNGIPTVIAVNATGGLSTSGAIFSYGLKSNLQVLNQPANLTGLVGGGAVVKVPLSSIFGGNTGALVYSVTSSNTAAATVALVATGDTVKVTPVAAGTSTITVTALDVDGSNISTPFTATVINANVTVSGTVTYGTTTNTIGAVTVTLTPASGAPVSAVSNASGVYSIANVPAGTYTLTASKTGNWGGVTGGDALVVARHAAGIALLTGLPLQAADVNNSSSVTGGDALLIVRRAASIDASFPAGDWTFASQSVTVASGAVTANVSGLAVGDVNASYTPASGTAFAKSAPLSLSNGTEKFGVATSSSVAIGSVTLRISAQSAISEITSKLPGFVSQIDGSNATLVWYAADAKTAVQLNANEAIATVKLADKAAAGSSVSITTEMTDINGAVISSNIAVATLPMEFSLMQNYPNPFNPSTTINYNLPQSGKVTLTVFNIMGQEVAKLVNEQKDAGSYSVEWAPKNLASGMYIYRINVQTEKELLTSSKRLMLLK